MKEGVAWSYWAAMFANSLTSSHRIAVSDVASNTVLAKRQREIRNATLQWVHKHDSLGSRLRLKAEQQREVKDPDKKKPESSKHTHCLWILRHTGDQLLQDCSDCLDVTLNILSGSNYVVSVCSSGPRAAQTDSLPNKITAGFTRCEEERTALSVWISLQDTSALRTSRIKQRLDTFTLQMNTVVTPIYWKPQKLAEFTIWSSVNRAKLEQMILSTAYHVCMKLNAHSQLCCTAEHVTWHCCQGHREMTSLHDSLRKKSGGGDWIYIKSVSCKQTWTEQLVLMLMMWKEVSRFLQWWQRDAGT